MSGIKDNYGFFSFAQVEDEVDEINAKVFSELERKLQE